LDERALPVDEKEEFCALFFEKELPDASSEWDLFQLSVEEAQYEETKPWNPISKRREPWINCKKLKSTYP